MSNRVGHQAGAQTAWLGWAATAAATGHPLDIPHLLAGAIVASSMCADDWSPDADQGGLAAKVIPGGHRGPTHMPEVVAAVVWAMWMLAPADLAWFVAAAACAWGSHLALDFLLGGIPFLSATIFGYPQRIGGGLKTGGFTDTVIRWAMIAAVPPLAWVAAGQPWPV